MPKLASKSKLGAISKIIERFWIGQCLGVFNALAMRIALQERPTMN